MRQRETDLCPFLIPVVADRLWIHPVGAYCRRPDGPLRMPAVATLARVCATRAHLDCEGYRASVAQAARGTAADEGSRP